MRITTLVIIACLIHVTLGYTQDRMLLRDIGALTLRRGEFTTYRRTSAVPQLECRGSYCNYADAQPSVVQCSNKGFDGKSVQWECKGDLGSNFKFGDLKVSCEGYSGPNDQYILVGSCGLRYELELTPEGRKNIGSNPHQQYRQTPNTNNYNTQHRAGSSYVAEESSSGGFYTIVIILAVVAVIYCLLTSNKNNVNTGAANTRRTSSNYSNIYPSAPTADYPRSSYTSSAYTASRDSSEPGFWTGAATGAAVGAAAGYAYGRSTQSNIYPSATPSYVDNSYSSPSYGNSSGNSYSSSSHNDDSSSKETRTATGYANTETR